jgi:putative oxidoreductase
MPSFGPVALRLAVGVVFVAHGAQKLFGIWGGGGPSGTAAFFAHLGLSPAFLLALLVGFVELLGGLLLLAGAFTLYAAIALTINMIVAVWKVHLANGFFLNWTIAPGIGHGHEFNSS